MCVCLHLIYINGREEKNLKLDTNSPFSVCFVNRLLAIWWPLKLQITKKRAKGIIVGIWVIALSITLPWALFFQLVPFDIERPDIELCLEIWPDGSDGTLYFLFANLLACYVIPMALISICYIMIWIKVCCHHRQMVRKVEIEIHVLINHFVPAHV
jgi:hypothetical protein